MSGNIKVYVFLIHSTKETAAFTDITKAYNWIKVWFLSETETEILINTGIYCHEEIGVIELIKQDLNPILTASN